MNPKPKRSSTVLFDEAPTVRHEIHAPQFARTERLERPWASAPAALDDIDERPASHWQERGDRRHAGPVKPQPWPGGPNRDGRAPLTPGGGRAGRGPRVPSRGRLMPGGLAILLILLAGVVAIGPVRMFASAHENDGDHHQRTTARTTPTTSTQHATSTPQTTTTPQPTTTTTPTSTTAPGVPPLAQPGSIANMQFTAQGNASGSSQPGLQGADIEIRWNWLEPNAPVNGVHQYNWAQFDSLVARWHAAGKRVMLLVHYTNYTGSCSGEQEMPAWEIARIQHTCDSAYGVVTPNYFDPTFVADLQGFVRAIGAHYAASPYKADIAYVRIGTGIGGEEIPNRGGPSNAPVWNQMQQWGYTPIAWRNWVEARLADYKAAFPYATVLNSVNTLWATDPNPDPTTGMKGISIQAEIAYWAAAHGFGIGCQTLSPGFDYAKIREITTYIRAHWPQTFIEFQTKTGVSSLAEVQGDIQTAYCYGAKAIEWYANVANTPAYQQAFQSWQQLASGRATANAINCP